MQKEITPNLWFDGNAKEAVEFYISVFPESKVISTLYYPNSAEEGLADFQTDLAGQVLTMEFELSGNRFVAINAGSEFRFNESVSFSIPCEDQKEINYYWEKLSAVPESEQCGWCKDRFGLSWQVVPKNMEELLARPKAFAKMMQMHKIIIEDF
jgi:predicted 3-demethylubiquinone-9 3-methyltransferase (glyoxalase superfamily)